MNKEFNEKTEIEELACRILEGILKAPFEPRYLTKQHKETSNYYDEFEKEFEKQLNYEQKKDYNSLLSIKNMVLSTEFDYRILCGMQIKSALDEIIKNPLRILQLYQSEQISARNMYKSVKQKTEEHKND